MLMLCNKAITISLLEEKVKYSTGDPRSPLERNYMHGCRLYGLACDTFVIWRARLGNYIHLSKLNAPAMYKVQNLSVKTALSKIRNEKISKAKTLYESHR
jgi:hypothetical protein